MPVPLGWEWKTGVARGGKGFLCTERGYYIPLIYWAAVPGSGGKTPPHYLSALTYSKNEKIEL